MPRWRSRRPVREEVELNLSRGDKRRLVYSILDAGPFPWSAWIVTGTSVFAYSYNVAALDFAVLNLQYLYWHDNMGSKFLLEVLSSVGLIWGSLLFGYWADKYGRRSVGGSALVLMFFSIVGFSQSSSGMDYSMSMLGWLCFWRTFLCIGAGALLPINSVVMAEWAPTHLRTKSLAQMFLMQPVGQLFAAGVSLLVTHSFNDTTGVSSAKMLDRVWRIVVGVGVIPTLGAMICRLRIPESPRYLLDVDSQIDRAYKAVQKYEKSHDATLSMSVTSMFRSENLYEVYNEDYSEQLLLKPFSRSELQQYFIQESNWRYLVGIAACWYLLNIALTALDGSNILTMNILFHRAANITDVDTTPILSIQELADLYNFSWQYITLISAGSVLGVFLSIPALGYIRHRLALVFGFITLAITLLTAAVTLSTPTTSSLQTSTIILYILSYMIANFGPSVLLVILSSEIFPTRYRATAFGIAMSCGNFASLLMKIIMHYTINGISRGSIRGHSIILGVSSGFLILGTFVAWIWIPEPQKLKEHEVRKSKQLVDKTLEELAEGAMNAQREGQVIGLRSRFHKVHIYPPRGVREGPVRLVAPPRDASLREGPMVRSDPPTPVFRSEVS